MLAAAFFSSPDYPPVRGQDVAHRQPLAYLRTSAETLAGQSSLQTYGPPYTGDRDKTQHWLFLAPARWFGVTIPVDASRDLVLDPLQRAAVIAPRLQQPLRAYRAATPAQQQAWLKAYLVGLQRARVVGGQVVVPPGPYGPVSDLMEGMLALGRAGLLEGALESGPHLPYDTDRTPALLFFQDDVDHAVAKTLDMLGEQ